MNSERQRKVEELYRAAVARTAEGRSAFLDGACGNDSDLRRQVELLLESGNIETLTLVGGKASLSGRRLGPYQILSPLGAGGMGEVYRAHDDKLGRDVALKTLPLEFANHPERLARLRREARTLASLNHPNIATIFGLEESGGMTCLVLELVEGETLRGPLPIERALRYAHQVASALEAAHAAKITHRDLKPANVMITPRGVVKVLDFGLAKALWGTDESQDPTQQATETMFESVAGQIAGTPPYMSPEQVRGQEIDARTDIWAFGCLLYELLCGKRAFQGNSTPDTLAAVLEREPDWKALPPETPAKIRALLQRSLQKDPVQRVQEIGEALRAIEEVQRKRNPWILAAVAAASIAAVAIGVALWTRGPAAPASRDQWVQLTQMPDPVGQPAFSPDGRMLTFIRGPETFPGPGQVYVKILPDGEPAQLTNDPSAKISPVFSPDGTRIAYTAVNTNFEWDTYTVPVLGGQPQLFLRNASGLVWSGPQQVLFAEMRKVPHMGIVMAGENRMDQREVYLPSDSGAMAHRSYASPDGKTVLLVEMDRVGGWVPCRLVRTDHSGPDIKVGPAGAGCTFGAWSPDGKWMYVTSNAGGSYHVWRQRFPDGEPEQITSGPTEEEGIAMAPDGRSFVTSVGVRTISLWLHDAKGDRQISRLEGSAAYPRFTADGKKLVYMIVKGVPDLSHINTSLPGELWASDLESGRAEPLIPGFQLLSYDVSRDGQQAVVETPDAQGKHRLWVAYLDRRSPPAQIPNVEGQVPRFGPEGEIFFQSTEGGLTYAYRVHQDGSGLRKAVEQPIYELREITQSGWLIALSMVQGSNSMSGQAFPLAGGPAIIVGRFGEGYWSPAGRSLAVSSPVVAVGVSYVIPFVRGQDFPRVPYAASITEEQIAKLPGVSRIEADALVPGVSPGVYAFSRGTTQRNLYRIPIQ